MDVRVCLLLTIEALLALWLLSKMDLMKNASCVVCCVFFTFAAFALRAACLSYETLDYQNFLTHWVSFYRENGGFAALDRSVGNYNIPYLYFMALFSYSSIQDLYLIKLLSILFDVLLAWGCTKLLSHFCSGTVRLICCFFSVLFLPTVVLNSALWAQCDSIYVALAVLGIVCALEDRPCLSMVLMALSFGFKLQAVFIMPVYAVIWMYGKFNWKHFLIFPLTYIVLVLPAVIAGRPFIETLTLYTSQTGSIGSGMNYNSPSVFAIITDVQDTEKASKLAIACAFGFMLAVLLSAFIKRKNLSDMAVLIAAALLAAGIPFLLPHMHDRYFFGADIITLVLAFALPICAPLAVLTQFASFLGYHAYLKMRYLLLMDRGAWALIVVLISLLVCWFASLAKKNILEDKIQP